MKKFLVLAMIAVSAFSSQAAWLYWQVENQTEATGLAGEWATAKLYVRNLTTGEVGEIATAKVSKSTPGSSALRTVSVDAIGAGYGYYVELISSSGDLVGYTNNSSEQTYANLVAGGMITDDLEAVPTAIWHGGSYSAPEPTSAMLMLLGVAGLALRRKSRKQDEV